MVDVPRDQIRETRIRRMVREELDRALSAMSAAAGKLRGESVAGSSASAAAHVLQAMVDESRMNGGILVSTAWPEIKGRCPACGNDRLFVGAGGYLTCPRIDCPMPDAASRLLIDHTEREHRFTVHAGVRGSGQRNSFTIRHPLMDRLSGRLEDCPLHAYLRLQAQNLDTGDYIAELVPNGSWTIEKKPARSVDGA